MCRKSDPVIPEWPHTLGEVQWGEEDQKNGGSKNFIRRLLGSVYDSEDVQILFKNREENCL